MIPVIPQDKKRIFILSPGRSGSSLLAALLSDAGATFPNESETSWNPLGGAFESDAVGKAAFLYAQAHEIQASKGYSPLYRLFHKKIVTYKRAAAKKKVGKLMKTATCFKETANLHYLPRVAAFLGYWPVIVLNYRDFPEWMGSMFPGQRHLPVEALARNYLSTMENSIAVLGLFGGCVVNYRDLMDPGADQWAHILSEVTGLSREVLLNSRSNRFGDPGPESPLPVRMAQAEEIMALARGYEGMIVPPAPSAVKRWLVP